MIFFKMKLTSKKVHGVEELSLAVVEEFKVDRVKNHEITKIIEIYGQNIFNNVIIELKKYINS